MTHAELSSTSEPATGSAGYRKHSLRPLALIASAGSLCLATLAMTASSPASADQISDAKAQAAAISAKIGSIDAQREQLTGQVTQADYQLSQLSAQIAAGQAQIAKDQAKVNTDQSQLRTEAVSDYVSSGTTNQVTQMFTSNVNTSGIRSEYSSIATGNVTDTIDHLHTAQAQLQATQTTLVQHQAQQHRDRATPWSAPGEPSDLARSRPSITNPRSTASTPTSRNWSGTAGKPHKLPAAKAARDRFLQHEGGSFAAPAGTGAAAAAASATSTSNGGGGGGGAVAVAGAGSQTVTFTVAPPVGIRCGGRRAGRAEPSGRALRLGGRDARGRLRLLGPGAVDVLAGGHRSPRTPRVISTAPPRTSRFLGHRAGRPAFLRPWWGRPRGDVHRWRLDGRGALHRGARGVTGVRTGDGFAGVGRVG